MSATTITGPIRGDQVWTRAKRTVLIALAVVVLFVAAFFIGRATSNSSSTTSPHVTSAAPASTLIARECTQNGQADFAPSHVGRAC
jgi:hypothetical protein